MYCRKCGNMLDDDAGFCSVCGTPVKKRTGPEPGRKKTGRSRAALLIGSVASVLILAIVAGGVIWFMQEKKQAGISENRQAAGESRENEEKMPSGPEQEDETYTDETAQKYYARILTEYQEAEQKGFAGKYEEFPYVNPDLINGGSRELYYTLEDLCEDGVPELVIAEVPGEKDSGYKIVDIYGYADSTPQHLSVVIGFGIDSVSGDGRTENRTECFICEGGMLKYVEDDNPSDLNTAYLSLKDGTAELNYERQILYSNGVYAEDSSGGLAADEITEAEYEQLLKEMEDQYPVKTDMEWKKIADLSIGAQGRTGKLLTFHAAQQYNSRPGKYPRTDFVVSQSSCLETGGVRHSADQMEDADQSTYWADGRKGNGVGEKIVYMSPFAQEIRGLYIEPGLTSSAQEFRENGRPLKIRIIFGNGQVGTADLSGFHYSEGASLYIAFEEPIITDSCEIIIEEAQSGTENNNTCISTMFLVGEQAE